jgi:nondiscriminating aspartyl-tRNA synthetase
MEKFIHLSEEILKPEKDLLDIPSGTEVEVFGMIHNTRITKWGGFIILRKAKGLLQTVFQNETAEVTDLNGRKIKVGDLSRETAVKIKGTINTANIKDVNVFYKTVEVSVKSIEVLSVPTAENLIDVTSLSYESDANFTFKLDNRQITLRNTRDIAIFKVSAQIVKAFTDYLTSNNFTQIFTPKIVSAGAEGGANIFELEYFGKKAYLAQSPQFYKQIGVGVFERVFEIAPVYRAEKHSTSRHLNEYISIDLEMGFIKDHNDIMQLEAKVLRYVLEQVENNCKHELAILNSTIPKLPNKIPIYRLSEVHEVLHEHYADKLSQDHRGEPDLAPEEEVFICDYANKTFNSDFVFVTHFPRKHRAFYSYDDPENPELTLSFDLIMRGKEITSGSQRIHKAEQYIAKMKDLGMNPDNFKFYLDTFKNGMPPHGGLAIGLERLTAGILNIQNVKEASLFPRDINRITP